MLRKGIVRSRGVVGSQRKKYIDSGTVKYLGPRKFRENPPLVPVDKSRTSPEEDEKFISVLMKEFQEDNPDFIPKDILETTLEEPLKTSLNVSTMVEQVESELPQVVVVAPVITEPVPEPKPEGTSNMDNYYIVIDFEATCFKRERVPREETEIIEFAAMVVDKQTLTPISEFDAFVRPTIHPKLDPFCTELTSIVQEDVDGAFTFPTVLRQFSSWLQQFSGVKTFCSWGYYDKNQLVMECNRNSLKYPFDEEHINIKELFSEVKGYKRKYGVAGALKHLKMEFIGTHHRGIDDVRNIVRIMQAVLIEPS